MDLQLRNTKNNKKEKVNLKTNKLHGEFIQKERNV